MPYAVGRLLGVHMHFHVCFMYELHNIIPFLVAGVINGYVMSKRPASKQAFYSMSSHFAHIFVSSMASLFYMISHGFSDWAPQMGMVFISLIVAVVVPCTLSDVVVPIYFARKDKTS
jgi:ABC-type iron transport system FetAB permease component